MSNLINDERINNKNIQSFEYEKTIVSDGSIIGSCELGSASIEVLDDSSDYTEIKGSWIKTIHGSFYVTNVLPVQEKVKIKLECYDIKYKLDTPFNSNLYTNLFPCSLMEFRNAIFDNVGVSHDDTVFPNSNLILTKLPYFEEGISNRNVISVIAQAGASFVDTDQYDKFYFNYFTDKVYEVNDYQELTTEKVLTSPVNTIVLGRGNSEDNVYYPENVIDKVAFRIDNNYILDPQDVDSTDDTRYKNIIALYDRLKDTKYLIFSMKTNTMLGKLDIKLGDKVRYKDIWGNILEAPVMRKKLTFLGGNASDNSNYSLELSADEIKETSTNFNYASSIKSDILRVERKADKASGVIQDLVEKVMDIEKKVEVLKVEFDTPIIVITTDGGNHPLVENTYMVDYKLLYLNKEIKDESIKINTKNEYEGISVSYTNDFIKLHVEPSKPISSIDNKYLFEFEYSIDDNTTYKVEKTLVLSLTTNSEVSVSITENEPEDKNLLWLDTKSNLLKRYEEDTWVIINDYSLDKSSISKSINELTHSQLNNLEDAIIKEVQQSLSSSIEQNVNEIKMQFKSVSEDISILKDGVKELKEDNKYIKFDASGITIGEDATKEEQKSLLLKINNDGIGIYKGNAKTPVSSWKEDNFETSTLKIGNFEFIPRHSNGSLSIRKVESK